MLVNFFRLTYYTDHPYPLPTSPFIPNPFIYRPFSMENLPF